ncbi:MAG: hypothetical protein ACJA0F_002624 [Dinoroseobacter sp.]|jgi:hypothetical protein
MIRIVPLNYALSATGSTKREHLPSGDRVNLKYGSAVARDLNATARCRIDATSAAFPAKSDTRESYFSTF